MIDHENFILVVEDEPDLREPLAIFLESEGYQVLQAGDGGEALDCLRSTSRCCLILLDLFMPVMDGWVFRRAQLSDPTLASIPVLVISADRSAANAAAAFGAVGYLLKPIDFDHLMAKVAAHC